MILKTFPEVTGQVGRCVEGMGKDLKKIIKDMVRK